MSEGASDTVQIALAVAAVLAVVYLLYLAATIVVVP